MLTATAAVWILAAAFCCFYPKANTDMQRCPKGKVHGSLLSADKMLDALFLVMLSY